MRTQETQKNHFITVEANIGTGKSTLLPKLVESLNRMSDNPNWVEIQEPAEDPEFDALLRKFYEEPTTENRIKFQYYITDRRFDMVQKLPEDKNYIIERSLLSDTIFCQVNFLTMEKPDGCYMNYFYHIKEKFMDYPRLSACVYLKSDPIVSYRRMIGRGREAEEGVSYSYIEDLHNFHEAVLPQECREYKIPLMTFDWNHFGSEDMMAAEILDMIRHK